MSNEHLELIKGVVAKNELEASDLKELATKYWIEIANRFYTLDRPEIGAKQLSAIKMGDLRYFFKVT